MPRARGRALTALCAALCAGDIVLDRSADRDEVRARLLALPGIGPWTADYVAMRALGSPDVFLPTDVGVRNALRGHGLEPAAAERLAERWRPWRSYALMHLWASLAPAGAGAAEALTPESTANRLAPVGAVTGEGE
jgi:AraC family transcriptional regulator of adaptative response / DNA-3-methyladenine glycosylase II